MTAIVNITSGAFAAGSTPTLTMQLVDAANNPIGASAVSSLTLSLADTLSGAIINGVSQVRILDPGGRGALDALGNLTINFVAGDLAIAEAGALSRMESAVIDWVYNGDLSVGRQEVRFLVVALAAP